VLVQCQFRTQQVQSHRLVTAQVLAFDAGERRTSAVELAFLTPGLGGLQTIAVGMATRLRGEIQPGQGSLGELALRGQRGGALRGGEFGGRARCVCRHASGQQQRKNQCSRGGA
jgi:hypothetical protein